MQNCRVLAGLFLVMGVLTMTAKAETDCASVVTATVAETKAGAGDWWSQPIENLVRSAAGSACVKALSGRYDQSALSTDLPMTDAGPHVISLDEAEPVADNTSAASGESGTGITFKPLSGSPTRKPYERQRQTDDN